METDIDKKQSFCYGSGKPKSPSEAGYFGEGCSEPPALPQYRDECLTEGQRLDEEVPGTRKQGDTVTGDDLPEDR